MVAVTDFGHRTHSVPALMPLRGRLGSLTPLAATALIFIALMPATLVAMGLDTRVFQGDDIWLKPFKFQIALAVFFATVAWFGIYTSDRFRSSAAVRWFTYAASFAALGEIVWIGGAAFFGTASHFNVGTPTMAIIYSVMGVFAVTLTTSALVVGIGVLRNKESLLADPMRLALGWSMILTFVATIITAGYMSSAPGHLVGDEAQRAAHWLIGWSTQVGDLRVPHFFATHAIHFVPVFALGVVALVQRPTPAKIVVWALLAGYTFLIAFTFQQAIAGLPLIGSL
ncbi:MAG: hypothetical protein AAF737_06425 [Pseudomonadota bacterium]